MSVTCVIGLQWGDEAKGKLVDLLTDDHQIVVRYQGGSNAGHTVVTGGQTYKLSLIPSGILTPDVQCVVTGGVVLNPASILQEIDALVARGIKVGSNLMLSDRAHVILPWHIAEDAILDKSCSSGENIGTTMRGIGPCYRDKMGRVHAVRLGDLYRGGFPERIRRITAVKNRELTALAGDASFSPLDAEQIIAEYEQYARRLQPHVGDSTQVLLEAMESGQRVLFEGAQGALLDIDHGTFPFVTSSNSSGVGIASGSGVPGKYMTKCVGVFKAYSTRVGGGPFPTEQDNDIGRHLRERGHEYGTVTGRARRCGWFDAVAGRYAARLSGVDTLAVTLLDVLSELDELHHDLWSRCTPGFGVGLPYYAPEAWVPHVTLARMRGARQSAVARFLEENGGMRLEPFRVTRFVLLSARPGVGGGPYGLEAAYALSTMEESGEYSGAEP